MKKFILLLLFIFSCTPSEPNELTQQECSDVVECNGSIYHCGDLTVLQEFINLNSTQTFKKYLDSNSNGCIEPVEFGDQTWENGRLVYLDLNYNQDGTIDPDDDSQDANYQLNNFPEDIGNLDSLQILKLNDNEFIYLPESFTKLIKLKHLELENNLLTYLPEDFGDLVNLEQLVINYNQIEYLPGTIGNLISLERLWVHHNELENLPSSIGNMNKLEWLYLHDNSLQSLPESIGDLENLKILNLNNNSLSTLPEDICNLNLDESELQFSFDNNNVCAQYFPDCVTYANSGPQNCTECPPFHFAPEGICVYEEDYQILQNFIDLNSSSLLKDMKASDCYNDEWWHIDNNTGYTRLVEITFMHKELHSNIPDKLGGLDSLRILRLTNNNLTGGIPDTILTLTNLQKIMLNSNNLNGNIPNGINLLMNLDTLWLNDNSFSGEIPVGIISLDKLRHLRLEFNNLSGVIPANIGDLLSIKHLILNDNDLSGGIPTSIGNLINMRQLHLFNNDLSGYIPGSICNIDSLRSYLHNNQLCPGPTGYPECLPDNHIGFQYCEE